MSNKLEVCPYCQQKIFKGAMRCVACGKILQTPEDRIATIEKLNAKPKFNLKRLVKWTVMIIVLIVLYHYFSERLIEIIKDTIRQ